MNLECLNNIITSDLAIQIDLTSLNSWDLNTGLTSFSLTKWSGAVSDNINLFDFGLTDFDKGMTNKMWDGVTIASNDNLFSMNRVGYNTVINPTTDETSGITVTTNYLPISGITSGMSGNYFELDGGYLQGFFKLEDYNYELLPARYGNGITIETLLYLHPESQGIFYMMGARAEDKYNPYFSGETSTGNTVSGVTTSLDNFLDALEPYEVVKKNFKFPEEMMETKHKEFTPIDNINNNVIAFELTPDKKIGYKYVNNDGLVITNTSSSSINPTTGWTIIDTVFIPYNIITDLSLLECAERRLGKLVFYINGRAFWTIKDFPEFYFKGFNNDKEKQLGVPYSISWGGGSFGLGESWHYDYQTYMLYDNNDSTYINNNFIVTNDPIPTECYVPPTGDTYLAGLSLSEDNTTFTYTNICEPEIELPLTVMKIEYTGGTGNTHFIKFDKPISVLSNRDYVVNLSIFVNNIFNSEGNNKISVLMYSDDVDVNIVDDIDYMYPLKNANLLEMNALGLHPFLDIQEYEWSVDGTLYYGETGFPVTQTNAYLVGYKRPDTGEISYAVTGQETWVNLQSIFRTENNTGKNSIYLGLLIESTEELISGGTISLNDFKYTAADILVKDERKNNLTIEENFDYSFIGGIQKLRIYNKALTSPEILHNSMIETKDDPTKNIKISKGGRIIYR
ncbi:MAG: hypothetical protein PF487_15050 [Bacteroidales bacterium]|jgi:hypothetical protein|nr:hypothetical protein [Bacteroidales bacterium]